MHSGKQHVVAAAEQPYRPMVQTQIHFVPSAASMCDYLQPHLPWIETVIGCPFSDAVTFQIELPITRFVAQELLEGVPLDKASGVPEEFNQEIQRWELPHNLSPRINLSLSRERRASIGDRQTAWYAEWRESPVAVWLKDESSACVIADVPYVSLCQGLQDDWASTTVL